MYIRDARIAVPHLPQLDLEVYSSSAIDMPALLFSRQGEECVLPAGRHLHMWVHPDLHSVAKAGRGVPTTGAALPTGDGLLGLLLAGTEEHIAILLVDMGATALQALAEQVARSGQVPLILSMDAPTGPSPQLLLVPAVGGVAGMLAKAPAAKPLSQRSMAAVTGEVVQSLLHPAHKELWGFDVTKLHSLSVNVQGLEVGAAAEAVENPYPDGQLH